jgi:uncharacterized repeat protein (TIGR03803 family)
MKVRTIATLILLACGLQLHAQQTDSPSRPMWTQCGDRPCSPSMLISRYRQRLGGPESSGAANLGSPAASTQGEQRIPEGISFNTLINLDGGADGGNPAGSLVQGLDGNLYGTTWDGGANQGGTLFKISPSGNLTTIYNFCSQANCADGGSPAGPPVLGTDGNFYGITQSGGTASSGTAFKITPDGTTLTVLHNWCSESNCADGFYAVTPQPGSFMPAPDGNFYGTNDSGCPAACGGTVFKLTPRGTLTTLYTFCSQTNCTDGQYPEGGLTRASNGNFYGTTSNGGANGKGTVFKITPAGQLTTLYNFCSQGGLNLCTDGALPFGPVIQANDGNLYGTTTYGGANANSAACLGEGGGGGNCGTVFKITPSGTLTTIYNFCALANCADGASPGFSLLQASDGNFYGSTIGNSQYGITLFSLTPTGNLITLYTFNTVFQEPEALFQATNGTFYGVTFEGGNNDTCGGLFCGIAFSLDTGLHPFVETVPTIGRVGKTVRILGNDLSQASRVSFNGAQADFKVISDTEIQATVPCGATTGFVTVTRSGKQLKTNARFQVLP